MFGCRGGKIKIKNFRVLDFILRILKDGESCLKNAFLSTSSGHRVHYWLMVCAKITVSQLCMYKQVYSEIKQKEYQYANQ